MAPSNSPGGTLLDELSPLAGTPTPSGPGEPAFSRPFFDFGSSIRKVAYRSFGVVKSYTRSRAVTMGKYIVSRLEAQPFQCKGSATKRGLGTKRSEPCRPACTAIFSLFCLSQVNAFFLRETLATRTR